MGLVRVCTAPGLARGVAVVASGFVPVVGTRFGPPVHPCPMGFRVRLPGEVGVVVRRPGIADPRSSKVGLAHAPTVLTGPSRGATDEVVVVSGLGARPWRGPTTSSRRGE